jgi:hypothetical protein
MAVYDSGKAAAEVVVAAQHLALPVDEVHPAQAWQVIPRERFLGTRVGL